MTRTPGSQGGCENVHPWAHQHGQRRALLSCLERLPKEVSEGPLHVADGAHEDGFKTEGTKSDPQVLTFRQFLPQRGKACVDSLQSGASRIYMANVPVWEGRQELQTHLSN